MSPATGGPESAPAPPQPPRPATPQPAGSGLLVGRPFGIPVYVAPSWFLVAALLTWFYAPRVQSQVPGIGGWGYAVALAFAVLLYLSVLVHELAHSLVALALGLRVRRISLHLLGGVSEIEQEPPTPGKEFLVAVAGPVLSLLLGVLGVAAALVTDGSTVLGMLARALATANLVVGVFNLLPGLPLDGGRLLQAGVWRVSGRRTTGIRAAGWTGRVVAVALLAIPVLTALGQGREPTLFNLLWTLLLASFIWVGATQALRAAALRDRLPAVSARALARGALPVAGDLPLAEGLRRASEVGARGLVVVDPTGAPVALVNEAAVRATPQERRPWVTVSAVARRLEAGLVLSPHLEGEDLLRALQQFPATEYLLSESPGAVAPSTAPARYDVLAAADVERALSGA